MTKVLDADTLFGEAVDSNADAPIQFGEGMRVELASDAAEEKWTQIFPVGTVYRDDFPEGISFTPEMLAVMAKNFEDEGVERATNYFHKGASNVDAPIEQKINSGKIKKVRADGTGLYGLIDWTEKAKAHIKNGEIDKISPEFRLRMINKRTGKNQGPTLTGAALLNDPFLTSLPRIAASEIATITPAAAPAIEGVKMNPKLLALLKLSEKATEAEIDAAIDARIAADVKTDEVRLSESTQLAETQGAMVKMQEQLTAQASQITALRTEARTVEVNLYVDKLTKAGKITPAIREDVTKMGLAGGVEAIKFFEKASPAVSIGTEIGVTGDPEAKNDKTEALARFTAKRSEFEAKGVKFTEAHDRAKAELRRDFELAFSA